jgi:hypothetical protein
MLNAAELDAPAQLLYGSSAGGYTEGSPDWRRARRFPSLREAIHVAMTEEAPAGQEPFIKLDDGRVLQPATLHAMFESLQGP